MAVEINISRREYGKLHNELMGRPENAFEKYIADPFVDFVTHPLVRSMGLAALRALWGHYMPRRVGRINVRNTFRFGMAAIVGAGLVSTAVLINNFARGARTGPDQQPVPTSAPIIPGRPSETPSPTVVIPTKTPTVRPAATNDIRVDVTPQSRFERRPR